MEQYLPYFALALIAGAALLAWLLQKFGSCRVVAMPDPVLPEVSDCPPMPEVRPLRPSARIRSESYQQTSVAAALAARDGAIADFHEYLGEEGAVGLVRTALERHNEQLLASVKELRGPF